MAVASSFAPHTRQITIPAPHHWSFYRQDALPDAEPTVSKHWRQWGHYGKLSFILLVCVCACMCVCWQRSYIFAFVLSSRLFLMPHQLMNQVCQVRTVNSRKHNVWHNRWTPVLLMLPVYITSHSVKIYNNNDSILSNLSSLLLLPAGLWRFLTCHV